MTMLADASLNVADPFSLTIVSSAIVPVPPLHPVKDVPVFPVYCMDCSPASDMTVIVPNVG